MWNLLLPSRVYIVVEAMTEDESTSEEAQGDDSFADGAADPAAVKANGDLVPVSALSASIVDLDLLYRGQRQSMVRLARLL